MYVRWKMFGDLYETTPVPYEFMHMYCNYICNDCQQVFPERFHQLPTRCTNPNCLSFNTETVDNAHYSFLSPEGRELYEKTLKAHRLVEEQCGLPPLRILEEENLPQHCRMAMEVIGLTDDDLTRLLTSVGPSALCHQLAEMMGNAVAGKYGLVRSFDEDEDYSDVE